MRLRGVELAPIPLSPVPQESEPPPGDSIGLAPPRLQPVPPPAKAEGRVAFELALAGTALLSPAGYGLGGFVELGPRFRLPFGALGISLRATIEQVMVTDPAPPLINLGGAVRYVIARPTWRVSPYLGLWAQGLLQRQAPTGAAAALPDNETGLALGGLVGAQVRLWHGGIFTELGYRHTVYQKNPTAIPLWNAAFLLLGYRFSEP